MEVNRMMTDFYRFTEYNDHEGESWNFYIKMSPLQREALEKLISTHKWESYIISSRTYTQEEVDILCENARDGYMPSDCELGTLGKLPESIDWDDDDPFYKGQIEDFCTGG